MASKVLAQAWVSLPTTTCPLSSNKLTISALFPSFKSTSISISRASTVKLKSTVTPIIPRRSVLVKAESTDGEEASNENPEVEQESVGVEEESVAVAVAVADPEPEDPEPEEVKLPRIRPVKLGDIMGILNKRAIEASDNVRPTPDIRTGDIVQIKLEVPENRRRASIYKGIVISKQNAGIHTTIRIRRIIAGIGVEIVFPVYSPNIKEIKVVGHRKVRRAKLYYYRDKLPRLSTFK